MQLQRFVRVDHVVIVSSDAEKACQRLYDATGLLSIPGGTHDGLGTRNRIVPLGEGYLEVLEVHDAEAAALNAFGRLGLAGLRTAESAGRTEHLAAWSAAVGSVEDVAAQIGEPTMALSRAGVSVQVTGADLSAADPARPFFLERSAGQVSPESLEVEHRVQPTRIVRMTAATAEASAEWLDPVPSGSTILLVETAAVASLGKVAIGFVDGSTVVLTSSDPLGEREAHTRA